MAVEGEDAYDRILGATEHNWCRAVDTGTGITVLGMLFKHHIDLSSLQTSLNHVLQQHPRLRSQIVWIDPDKPSFLDIPGESHREILEVVEGDSGDWITHVESELNMNPWVDHTRPVPVLFASVRRLRNRKSLFVIRVHTAACDRGGAAVVLSEFLHRLQDPNTEITSSIDKPEQLIPVEDAIPKGQANKPFWAHGVDLLGYSLGSLRHALLPFENIEPPRRSEFIRAVLDVQNTHKLLQRCDQEKTNLFGVLSAAGLKATVKHKEMGNRSEHYAIIGLVDCRKHIELLSDTTIGFYHSAILNTHQVNEQTDFWDLSRRCSESFNNAIKNRKHFTDMGDINYLMFQALQHPNLTPSGSLRTSLMVVFQDALADESGDEVKETLGLEDYVGCASVHGVGSSLAIFDSIRNGALHCNIVYPAPLHSRQQVQSVVNNMMDTLVTSIN